MQDDTVDRKKSHGVLDVVRNSLGGASLLDSRGPMKMTGATGRVKGKSPPGKVSTTSARA